MKRYTSICLFVWLVLHSFLMSSVLAVVRSNFTDESSLLAFKAGLSLEPNNILVGNWSTAINFCNWFGVSCSKRRQRVTALELPSMGLRGTISPHIGNLSFLASLDLSYNGLHGNLPHELGNLARLKLLLLRENRLAGSIPPSLCGCKELRAISLVYNNFSGGIPKELGILSKLSQLFLGGNNLGGTIPPSLGNMSNLWILGLEGNGLIGSIPSSIYNITSLLSFSLMNNYISGSFPSKLCHVCPDIEEINVSNNNLSGRIPRSISECRELVLLEVSLNRFNGSIPEEIGSLPNLRLLYIGDNDITGIIPPSLANLSSLVYFDAGNNHIHGIIPEELGRLSNLSELTMGINGLTGVIPQAILNITNLQLLSLPFCNLSGSFPSTTGLHLPNLEELSLQGNQFSGKIPLHLSNSSKLTQLLLQYNMFTGPVPTNLGSLQQLKILNFGSNQLTGELENSELGFLNVLSSCRSLEQFVISYNPLNGVLPISIGNHSSGIQYFYAQGCGMQGNVPEWIGSLKNLYFLHFSSNRLSGKIPPSIGELKKLQKFHLDENKIEGRIPDELCHLRSLGELILRGNAMYGSIPSCIGNLSRLQKLDLSSNKYDSSLPIGLWSLGSLILLNVSSNSFGGPVPIDANLAVIENLDLSWNQFSGNIPSTIQNFQRLSSLNMSNNLLQGPIPSKLGSLVALEFIDLSFNDLTGEIPKSFEGLEHLSQLNLSFNKLSGEIPTGGPFSNLTAQSFLGNQALCGKPILGFPSCDHRSDSKLHLLKYVLPSITVLAILVVFILFLIRIGRRKIQGSSPSLGLDNLEQPMISYHELVRATDSFSDANLLGVGSFGSVYRGTLSDGKVVAIKVLNLQLEGAFKSFDAECKVLRNVRHRNLVKVISSCSNPDLRALILQYMPNGSLEKWLYSHNYFLNLTNRVNILVDVAVALEYLHHGQPEAVVHCDLKPSNILLDQEMVAHVGDFGISKMLAQDKPTTLTATLGTLGYMAPEYGGEGRVSTRGDIYSLGIIVLETMTRKKPTDGMFNQELSLRQWVNEAFPHSIVDVIDDNLLIAGNGMESLSLAILELGLACSRELPEERTEIEDVVNKLSKIKLQLLRSTNARAS